jgi:hypothetical protein
MEKGIHSVMGGSGFSEPKETKETKRTKEREIGHQ